MFENNSSSILIIDDEDSMRVTLSILLKRNGFNVTEAKNGKTALEIINNNLFDLIITDLKIGDISGMEIIQSAKNSSPAAEILVITAYGTIESAVEAMRLGAFDYIVKPFESNQILLTIKKALERKRLINEVKYLRNEIKKRFSIDSIIGKSPEIQKVLETISMVAKVDTTVLLEGESGTGKEVAAKAIHNNSHRSQMPFIAINCGAIPETLLESELFGHVKGSFTGAIFNKKGLFEEADKGTIFLDEIGDTPQSTQVKLLRVLQDHEIRRVGSNAAIKIDVRVIAASNKNLQEMVKEGKLREDLFYRLNVINITIPPLRDRKDDIIPLSEHFIKIYSAKMNKEIKGITPDAVDILMSYNWKGNVRELENIIERTIALSQDSYITPAALPSNLQKGEIPPFPFFINRSEGGLLKAENSMTLSNLEKLYIQEVLNSCRWNQKEAAKKLGIGRNTLWRKIKEYNLTISNS
jgi:DNA-binding NtrC family response regulator